MNYFVVFRIDGSTRAQVLGSSKETPPREGPKDEGSDDQRSGCRELRNSCRSCHRITCHQPRSLFGTEKA